jgi:hypothetical protein
MSTQADTGKTKQSATDPSNNLELYPKECRQSMMGCPLNRSVEDGLVVQEWTREVVKRLWKECKKTKVVTLTRMNVGQGISKSSVTG